MRLIFSLAALAILSFKTEASSYPTSSYTMPQHEFSSCLSRLNQKAKEEGITPEFSEVTLRDSQFLSNIIGYDRKQPEFSESFTNYFNKRVTNWRVNKGRRLFQQHQSLLSSLYQKYGVPAHYIIAFWGLETNYGAYKGKMPIVDALVTLACDPRRSEFFTIELMNALKLMEKEQVKKEHMLGSWAGAMGHTQFMPSAYLQYAIDGDGDGKADLWNSVPDALTSAANFLQNLGWKAGFRWGREVSLSDGFDYASAGLDVNKTLSQWRQLGVKMTSGDLLPHGDMKASLLIPSGHKGPAFLVYDNFEVIMRWNRSEFYAIAVGHLADRISGHAGLFQAPPETDNMSQAQVISIQDSLNQLGFDVGSADGIIGPATRRGIRDFQSSRKMIADGFADVNVLQALKIALKDSE